MNRRGFLARLGLIGLCGLVPAKLATAAVAPVLPPIKYGTPSLLPTYRQLRYVQVLREFNEALAERYAIPFRHIDWEMEQEQIEMQQELISQATREEILRNGWSDEPRPRIYLDPQGVMGAVGHSGPPGLPGIPSS